MISIGLPAIKAHFLKEAIASVMEQTYPDFELIVVNDRGDHQIREITASFSDPRIRYVEGEDPVPVVENWNRTLSLAKGEFFVLFADDDRYDPEFLTVMLGLITRYPQCKIVHSRVRKIDVRGNPVGLTTLCPELESGTEFIYHRLCGNREQFVPEFLVHTDALRSAGGFVDLPLAWGSDDLTWFRLALEGGIACSDLPLTDWRQSPYQISERGNLSARLEAAEKYEFLLATLLDSLPRDAAISDIRSMQADHLRRQKAHLVAVDARNRPAGEFLSLFLRNRRQYQLEYRWMAYALYARYVQPAKRNFQP